MTEEMNYRELMGYPPAEHLMAVLVACEDEALLEKGMHYLEIICNADHEEPQGAGDRSGSSGSRKGQGCVPESVVSEAGIL